MQVMDLAQLAPGVALPLETTTPVNLPPDSGDHLNRPLQLFRVIHVLLPGERCIRRESSLQRFRLTSSERNGKEEGESGTIKGAPLDGTWVEGTRHRMSP